MRQLPRSSVSRALAHIFEDLFRAEHSLEMPGTAHVKDTAMTTHLPFKHLMRQAAGFDSCRWLQ